MTIEELYSHFFRLGAEFIQRNGEHPPVLVVVQESGKMAFAQVPDKAEAFRMQQAAVTLADCFAAIYISEAWMVQLPRGLAQAELDAAVALGAANHPERTEALVFSFLTASRQAIATCPISRPDNTVTRGGLHWLDAADPTTQGNMVRPMAPLH